MTAPVLSPRPADELEVAQRQAVDAWERARQAVEAVCSGTGRTSREARFDLERQRLAREREHDALLAHCRRLTERSTSLLGDGLPARAVLAHRNDWLRGRVQDGLTEAGVLVVGSFADGADAAGTIVAEQPDLVLVEDLLPTMAGLEVLDRVRTFAPEAVLGAQVADSAGIGAFVDAGAQAVFTRRVPPDEMTERLLGCLVSPEPVTVS